MARKSKQVKKPKKLPNPRWIHMRFNVAGWCFLLVSITVGISAVNSQDKSQAAMMFMIFGALMGAVTISVLMSHWMIRAVQIQRDLPDRAWQNQPVHLEYSLKNPRRRTCLGLSVSELAAEGIDVADVFCLHLPGKSVFRAVARFAPKRRGRISFQAIRVLTTFPFGLVNASRSFTRKAEMVVWPPKGRLLAPLLHCGAAETSASAPATMQGGQDEFFGLREYRAGDSPRWIHWRRSAGRTVPVVREMSRPLPDILFLVLDTLAPSDSPAASEARERILSFAATLMDFAFHRGYQVGLAMARSDESVIHPPAWDEDHRIGMLDALADADANDSRTLEQTVEEIPRSALRGAQVVAVTAGAGGLDSASTVRLAGSCRHLTVLTPAKLRGVFQDLPTHSPEGPP